MTDQLDVQCEMEQRAIRKQFLEARRRVQRWTPRPLRRTREGA